MKKTGRIISSARKTRGYTQSQLAEHFNISDRAVAKWEAGRSLPKPEIMLELSELLGIDVSELLGRESDEDDGESIFLWGHDFRNFVRQSCVVVIGSFDGLHLSDRAMLEEAYAQACEKGVRLAVFVFERAPEQTFLGDDALYDCERLTTDRARWLGLVRYNEQTFRRRCLNFLVPDNEDSRDQPPEDFLENVLALCDVQGIHISEDFHCGPNASCDSAEFRSLCDAKGVECAIHMNLRADGVEVSTKGVSELIALGDIDRANELLAGRYHRYCGEVAEMGESELGIVLTLRSNNRRRVALAAGIYAGYIVVRRNDGQYWKSMHLIPATFSTSPHGNDPDRDPLTRAVFASDEEFEMSEIIDMLFVHRIRLSGDEWTTVTGDDVSWERDNLSPITIREEWDLVLFGSE